MQTQFYVNVKEITEGPFSIPDICDKVQAQQYSLHDFIFVEANNDWIRLEEFNPVVKRLEVLNRLKGMCAKPSAPPPPPPKQVKSLPAQLILKREEACEVGNQLKVLVTALDSEGNEMAHDSELSISTSGSAIVTKYVTMKNGSAEFIVFNRKSEEIEIAVQDQNNESLNISEKITFSPAAPKKLIISAPAEAVAGQAITVMVKAVDSFGNLVTDFKSAMSFQVKSVDGGSQILIQTA